MDRIDQFDEKHGTSYLSNLYPVDVEYKGLVYQTSEAAFQAQKVDDPDKIKFTNLSTEGKDKVTWKTLGETAKRLGGKNGVKQLTEEERAKWNLVKDEIMEEVVRAKFTQHPDLARKLVDTGDAELIEGRNFRPDYYWGMKLSTGEGQNRLGKILMKIRDELK